MASDNLHLDTGSSVKSMKIHSVVLFSILDHHTRWVLWKNERKKIEKKKKKKRKKRKEKEKERRKKREKANRKKERKYKRKNVQEKKANIRRIFFFSSSFTHPLPPTKPKKKKKKRRKSDQKRVIGTLLGYKEKGVVHVRNCFPVPHTEKKGECVEVNQEFHNNMYALHQRSNVQEEIVGWFVFSFVFFCFLLFSFVFFCFLLFFLIFFLFFVFPSFLFFSSSLSRYTSGSEVNNSSVWIHNFYGNQMTQPPVHLCLGTDLSSGKMAIDGYVG